jgi:hypothetical protein
MIFEITELDPSENNTPRKTETPRKTGDSDPGRYGNITTNMNA